MRKIKLMADYGCFPLWEANEGVVGNVDPITLPISEALKEQLAVWKNNYEQTLDMDDPLASGFPSQVEENLFKQMGESLLTWLQLELGDEFEIESQL